MFTVFVATLMTMALGAGIYDILFDEDPCDDDPEETQDLETALPALEAEPNPLDDTPLASIGTSGEDQMDGTPQADLLTALAGSDTVLGLSGDDVIDLAQEAQIQDENIANGGAGDDTITGGAGFDLISGDSGDDLLTSFGNVVLNENEPFVGPSFERVSAGPGADVVEIATLDPTFDSPRISVDLRDGSDGSWQDTVVISDPQAHVSVAGFAVAGQTEAVGDRIDLSALRNPTGAPIGPEDISLTLNSASVSAGLYNAFMSIDTDAGEVGLTLMNFTLVDVDNVGDPTLSDTEFLTLIGAV